MQTPYYIFIYRNTDYPENGGGTFFVRFKEEDELHSAVNKIANELKDMLVIELSAYVHHEFQYEPIEIVKEFRPTRKN